MKDLTKGKPSSLILSFAFPIFLANLLQLTYSLADTRIVGSFLGEDALAAVGSTSTVSNLIIGFLLGLANGFAIITAQRFGAKDVKGMKKSPRPRGTGAAKTRGLCPQFDLLRYGRLPVGDGDRYGALLTYETRDIGRDTVVAVSENLARGLTRQLDRIGHLRAVVRSRGAAVRIVCGVNFQQDAVACDQCAVFEDVEQAVRLSRSSGGSLRVAEGHGTGRRSSGHDERL